MTWRPVALFGALVITVPAWPSPWLGIAVSILIVTIACVIDWTAAANPTRVTMSRTGDTMTRLGGTATVTLHVRNDGPKPLTGLIRDAWTPSAGAQIDAYNLTIAPRATASFKTRLTPTRRGDRTAVGVTIRAYGPMRFAYRQTTQTRARTLSPPWSVRVLPPFQTRRLLPEKLARLRVVEGAVAQRGRGQGSEFDALREYVPGDDIRSIDWRASARSQTLTVKTWRVERDRRIVSVIDTGRTSAVRIGDEPRLDAQIEATLLLSTVAASAGDHIDAFAVDTAVRATLDGRSHRAVIPNLIKKLAPLEPALVETDYSLVVSEVIRRVSKRALVVLFTSLDPGSITESLLPALPQLSSRHKVIVATVSDPEITNMTARRTSVLDVYRAAAAEQFLLERRKVAAALARYGVEVIDVPADIFASTVVDRYLMLKAIGQL